MPATTNKQQVLNHFFTALAKKYQSAEPEKKPANDDKRPVLEQVLYSYCREGATREQADRAFHKLATSFVDWNEVRVSSPEEVAGTLEGLPDTLARAERVIAMLQQLFEDTYSFELDNIDSKGLKSAAAKLSGFSAVGDYAVAWVLQQSLGGHAVPVDQPTERVAKRLGLLDSEQTGVDSMRASLEHIVPKVKDAQFNEWISLLARDVCWEDAPNCPACPMREVCPTGQANLAALRAADPSKAPKVKPR